MRRGPGRALYFADALARRRAEIKSQLGFARRGIRYKSQVDKPLPTGRVPGSRVRAVPLIKSETGRAKAGGRRERSSG